MKENENKRRVKSKDKIEEELIIEQQSFKKKYRLKRHHLGAGFRLIIMFVFLVVFMVTSVFFLEKSLTQATVHQFSYNETSNLDFKTCLKENDYFTEKCLPKDRQYIANLIEYIDADFKYNFNASSSFDYNYTYSIVARIIATEKNDANKVLYDKSEKLLDSKIVNMKDSKDFSIDETVTIDYIKYNELMNSFRKDYTLTLDSNLIVTLNVNVEGAYENIDDKIMSNQSIDLKIPLSEQTLDIGMNYKDINTSESFKKEAGETDFNKLLYVSLSVCFSLLTITVIVLLLSFIKKITRQKSNYEKLLEKILREFNQIIVETKNVPNFKDYNIISISSFEELLDVRETISKPILYIKVHNQKSCFMIIDGEEIFQYVLKAVDLE